MAEKKTEEKKTEEKKVENPEESYLKDLMSVSGHGGLFRFVSQGRNGIIVESLDTGKRMQAFASMKVSSLEDIAIYTEEEEVHLEEVLAAIHKYENGKEAISHKSAAEDLKDYFSVIMPGYDRDRVYVSDIKKVLSWYNLLLKYDLIEIGKGKPAEKAPEKPAEKASAKKEAETNDQAPAKTDSPPESDSK